MGTQGTNGTFPYNKTVGRQSRTFQNKEIIRVRVLPLIAGFWSRTGSG